MNIELTALEARVIGCMIEKQITTPDQYPLSLNALTAACNQKSNRDPVLDLSERAVQQVVEALIRKHWVIERSGFGSRVPKFHQVFCNSEFGSLKFSAIETAIVCELLLRGPQTPGELRSRASRMAEIANVEQVEDALRGLMARPEGAIVAQLPRELGRRESRYQHLFFGAIESPPAVDTANAGAARETERARDDERLARLEALVDSLCQEIADLKRRLG